MLPCNRLRKQQYCVTNDISNAILGDVLREKHHCSLASWLVGWLGWLVGCLLACLLALAGLPACTYCAKAFDLFIFKEQQNSLVYIISYFENIYKAGAYCDWVGHKVISVHQKVPKKNRLRNN
uniref:NuBaID C-terminal domain-containing protein n=1 Tax=Glossina pallidipes TaxID=7398 RepID=A0A1A9Z815_GLOPL